MAEDYHNVTGSRLTPAMKAAYLLLTLGFAVLSCFILRQYPHLEHRWIWSNGILLGAVLLTWFPYRSFGIACDLMVMLFMADWLFGGLGFPGLPWLFFPLMVAVFIAAGAVVRSPYIVPLVWIASISWLFTGTALSMAELSWKHGFLAGSGLGMLLLYTSGYVPGRRRIPKLIDVLVCSYSGHTAHFTEQFCRGARDAGSAISLHRFHYHRFFEARLNGDALVVAFPVIGCKPPWAFLYYLVFKLPRGGGKPAFILYTCIGGAENAGLLCWVILTLKGYRVVGRNWTLYPVNVPTFRLGPGAFWRWLDSLVPTRRETTNQVCSGENFARGNPAGIPWVFALTPAALVGILLDNKWLDTILYRNHTFKRRCNQCGICVRYCPAQRLRMVRGYPRAKGECTLCMGCVNLCPTKAMHLLFWTEYGRQYRPRWRRLVVKRPPDTRKTPAT